MNIDKIVKNDNEINNKDNFQFIREFQNRVDWYGISKYQNLSKKFTKKFNLILPRDSWLYKSNEEKFCLVKQLSINCKDKL